MHTIFVRGNTMVAVDIRSLTVDAPLDLKDAPTQKEILDRLAAGGGNQVKLNEQGQAALFAILRTPGYQE
jgi:hypothetical protein